MHLDDTSIQLVRDALIVTLKLTAPILAAGVLIGLIVSIAQAVTSIQDQTVAFVPKMIAMLIVAVLLAGWIVQRMIDYTTSLLNLNS